VEQVKRNNTSQNGYKKKKQLKKVVKKDEKLPKLSKPMKVKRIKSHPQFGTSQLELDFAKDFLDKLKVRYVWQFEAKEIKRFFDYYLPDHNIIIEVNGTYWHADNRIYEGKKLTKTQLHDLKVDEYKKKWACLHGIPILYVWEKDIKENPSNVMKVLKKRLCLEKEKEDKKKEKSKRHVNKLKKKEE
jgi:very-short-patch-repair endonuclease